MTDQPTLDLMHHQRPPPTVTRVVGDARKLAPGTGPRLDLLITDPAYAALERHRNAGGSTVRLQDWFPVLSTDEILRVLGRCCWRLKPGGFCLVVASWEAAQDLARLDGVVAPTTGTQPPVGVITELRWRTPWSWLKGTGAADTAQVLPQMGMGYYGRQAYELVLVLQRHGGAHPEVVQALRRTPNVVAAPRVRGGYPTQKPRALGAALLQAFCPPGGRALDPFAGSGDWLLEAAEAHDVDLELWDVNPEAPAVKEAP